jgi:hypothetical protein
MDNTVNSCRVAGTDYSNHHPDLPQPLLRRIECNDPDLTLLGIRDKSNFGEAGCAILARFLSRNTCITSLNLGRTAVGPAGAALLFPALTQLTAMTCLNLNATGIQSSGVRLLCNVFRHLTALIELRLSQNKLREGDGARICGAAAAAGMTRLKTLDLSNNSSKLNVACVLRCEIWLRELNLPPLPEGFAEIADFVDLTLYLTSSDKAAFVAASEASYFALLRWPEQLLQRIESSDVELLEVDIREKKLGTSGCRILARTLSLNTCITSLALVDCNIGSEGMRCLCGALTHLTTLTGLYISKNSLTSSGAAHVISILPHLTALTCLSLHTNQLSADSADDGARICGAAAGAGMTRLMDLRLFGDSFEVSDVVGCEAWRQINLPQPPDAFVSKADFVAILQFIWSSDRISFVETYCSNCHPDLPPLLLRRIENNDPDLTLLEIQYKSNFGEAGCGILARFLSRNTCIISLNLEKTAVGPAGAALLFPALTQLTAMTCLKLMNTNIQSSGVRHLCNVFRHLTALIELDLGYPEMSIPGDIARICGATAAAGMSRLTRLIFRSYSFQSFTCSSVVSCETWRQLNLPRPTGSPLKF